LDQFDRYQLPDKPNLEFDNRAVYRVVHQNQLLLHMVEFLLLHKESEGHERLHAELPRALATGIASTGKKRQFLVRHLGAMLGAEMHEAYLAGVLSKGFLRSLFFRKTHLPGAAKKIYFELARRVNPAQQKLFV